MSSVPDGKVCLRCGVWKSRAEYHQSKQASDGMYSLCAVCKRAATAAKRAGNPEEYNRRARERRNADPERSRAYKRAWQQENPDKMAAYARTWRASHKEADNAYQRARYQQQLDQKRAEARAAYYRRREDPVKLARMRLLKLDAIHRRKARIGAPDPDTLAYMAILVNDPCAYCGKVPAGTIDHITPIVQGGAHHWENLTAACETCNKSKNDKGVLHYLCWRKGV